MPQPLFELNIVFLRQSNIKANTSIAYLYFMVKIEEKPDTCLEKQVPA